MGTKLNLKDIILYPFPETQFYKQEYPKRQIVLHHTVSNGSAQNIFVGWALNPERVATALVIGGDGNIVQGFSSKYWAHHLGLHAANNTELNRQSIGIEICNWGGLVKKDGKFLNAYGHVVPNASVIEYPKKFRGYQYFQRYSDAQIGSLQKLLVYLCEKWGINTAYHADMWDIHNGALKGDNGIFTHVSFRKDKSDCHPQPELIEMLKGLSKA